MKDKLKIAFCLHGIIGGTGGKRGKGGNSKTCLRKGYEHYKKHILDHNDCDVFLHCATVGLEEEAKRLYEPKKSIFMAQPSFSVPKGARVGKNPARIQAHYHRFFSMQKVNQLRKSYQEETGTEYDLVYIGRYDLAWNVDVNFEMFDKDKIYFIKYNQLYNNGNFLNGREWFRKNKGVPKIKNNDVTNVPGWPKLTSVLTGYPHDKTGVHDFWAITNPDYADQYTGLYDNLDEYLTREPNTWMKGQSTIHDHEKNISAHRLIPCHLENLGLLDKIDFAFHPYDDCHIVRRMYFYS